MADLLEEVVREWMEVIFDFWTEDQIIDVVGPGGVPIWVKVNPSELRSGRYIVSIDPDSPASLTTTDRENLAMQRYTVLKENPMVDPELLTKYLVNEMSGVELDDVLKKMEPQAAGGQQPGQPTSPLGLAGTLQGAFGGGGG
jgi:hypothetical protein